MKTTIYVTALISIISLTAAAPAINSQASPGLFGASHPLNQLEVVSDNIAVSFGLSNASEVAEERLAEANQAANRGRVQAQERAMNQFNNVASKAQDLSAGGNVQGLLQEIQEKTPDNSSEGLTAALENAANLSSETGSESLKQTENTGEQVSRRVKDLSKQVGGLVN